MGCLVGSVVNGISGDAIFTSIVGYMAHKGTYPSLPCVPLICPPLPFIVEPALSNYLCFLLSVLFNCA
jgi:hypothetical protein